MATTANMAPGQKRKAALALNAQDDIVSALDSKRARYETSTTTDERADMEAGSPVDETTPESPASMPFSMPEPSIAETSVTSRSTKRPKNLSVRVRRVREGIRPPCETGNPYTQSHQRATV